jgi:plastocyanin
VDANGNAVSGGLGFDPARVRVTVGQKVRWTNTDTIAPHTVTESHGIFDLGGDYGETPANPPGFAPGTSVQREFSAGTFSYFCRVHPEEMRGVVATPVKLSVIRSQSRSGQGGVRIRAVWSRQQLPAGQAFDVQLRVRNGPWRAVRTGTRALGGMFRAALRKVNAFRARIRLTDGPAGASGYSPVARIKPQ